MAKLDAFLLCDFAQVREGLLFVASGGITRVRSRNLPLHVAVVVALEPDDFGQQMDLRLSLKRVETAERIAEIGGAFQAGGGSELQPGEGIHVPCVFPLNSITVPADGQYDLQLHVRNENWGDLSFWVVPPPAESPAG